jgi:agmatinase
MIQLSLSNLSAVLILLSSSVSNVKADPFAQGQIPLYGDDIDISGSKFRGVSTYANLPYVHCLGGKDEDIEKYDIAILGAPFDTVSEHVSFLQRDGLAKVEGSWRHC